MSSTTAVPTARGEEVSAASLGPTLMHEHIFAVSPEINQNWPETFGDEATRIDEAVAQLEEAYEHGVRTFVDLTVIGLGRYVPRIQRVAERTRVNIVVATGVYTWSDLPFFFALSGPGGFIDGPETIDKLLIRDIEEGIGETGVRAGVIKCATDVPGMTPGVERILRASAAAHRRTGVPISTHTAGALGGLEQQRILGEEGVDLERVVIGHVDRTPDSELAAIEQVIENGSTVGFDTFGVTAIRSDESRIEKIAQLCRDGYADRVILSHDNQCYIDWFYLARKYGDEEPEVADPGFTKVSSWALPALLERGVTEQQIEQMMVGTPRRLFESREPY